MFITVGIDLSKNSTGVVIINDTNIQMFRVVPKDSEIRNPHIEQIEYVKLDEDKKKFSYTQNELRKTLTFKNIALEIVGVMEDYIGLDNLNLVDKIVIEGHHFGKSDASRTIDTGMLSGIVRAELMNRFELDDLIIVQPTQLKKYATTNGTADKTMMEDEFIKSVSSRYGIQVEKIGKIDDVADAYFLARYGIDKITF